jgi:uncharacterized protein (UPF0297 family)
LTKKAYSTLEQRVEWLLAHPEFLEDRPDKRKLVKAMKRDNLISKSTFWSDLNLGDAIIQAKLRKRL